MLLLSYSKGHIITLQQNGQESKEDKLTRKPCQGVWQRESTWHYALMCIGKFSRLGNYTSIHLASFDSFGQKLQPPALLVGWCLIRHKNTSTLTLWTARAGWRSVCSEPIKSCVRSKIQLVRRGPPKWKSHLHSPVCHKAITLTLLLCLTQSHTGKYFSR